MNLANSNKNFNSTQQHHEVISANKYEPLPPLVSSQIGSSDAKLLVSIFDSDANTVSGYFAGEPIQKGYFTNKINPSLVDDFSYLNRNKLVNRRMAIRKQMKNSSGLIAISKTHPNYYYKNKGYF